jgi:hypothetical protein
MSFHDDEHDDHIHDIGFEGNEAVPISNPDDFYDQLDRRLAGEEDAPQEDAVTFKEMASALAVVLDFACAGNHPNIIAGRALALQFWVAPTESRYESVSHIAADVGLTKAALSKSVIQFADAMNARLPVGKKKSSRQASARSNLPWSRSIVTQAIHVGARRRRNYASGAPTYYCTVRS